MLARIDTEQAGADISPCGKYRYTLWRRWAAVPRWCLWLMLNPSTADATRVDNTIKRCIKFARVWGYTGILVGNAYAFRATQPEDLYRAGRDGVDVIGPDNRRALEVMASRASLIVCGWGDPGPSPRAIPIVHDLLRGRDPRCLVVNKNGEPGHPLYKRDGLQPVPFRARAREVA